MIRLLHYFTSSCILGKDYPLFCILLYVVGTARKNPTLLQELLPFKPFTVALWVSLLQNA